MSTVLTKEVLQESMKSGVNGVRDILRREQPGIEGQQPQDCERAEQVRRAKRAVEILRFDLNAMNTSEKKVVVEAGRQIIQDALTSVSKELQGQSGERLKILKAEQEQYLRAKEQMLELEKNLAALHERIALEAREFGIDVRDASTAQKIGYAIAGVAGFALTHKVWSSITGFLWGNKEKPGYLRRVLTFLAGVGGAIAGAVGLNALLHTKIGGEVAQYAGDVPSSLQRGLDESPLVTNTIPAVKETVENGAVAAVRKRRKKGEIVRDDEYYMALALAHLKDGYVIIGAGVDHFWKSGEALALKETPKLWEAAKNIINHPHDLWKAHWESVAIYGTSFGAVQTAMLMARDGIIPGIKAGALKTAVWEVQLLQAGKSVTLGLFNHDAQMMRSASYLEWKSILGYRRNRMAHYVGWRTKNSETLVDLIDEYRQYNNFISQLHKVESAQGIVKRFNARTGAIRSNIRNCLFTMKRAAQNADELDAITQEVNNILGSKVAQQWKVARTVGDIDDELLVAELPAALRRMDAVDAAVDTAKAGSGASKVAGNVGQTTPVAGNAAGAATDEVTDAVREAGGFGKNLQKAIDTNPAFRKALISTLGGAENPVATLQNFNKGFDAIQDVAEIERLAKAASAEKNMVKLCAFAEKNADLSTVFRGWARLLKVADGIAVVGDAAGMLFAVLEAIETTHMIEQLDERGGNEALRSLYTQRYGFHAAEFGIAGTGIVAGGLALAGVGGTIVAPVALATIPVTAVIYGAYAGHKWKEDQAHTAKDFAAENSLEDLIVDTRLYDFEERVGHGWELTMGNYEWMYQINPLIGPSRMLYRLVSGRMRGDTADLVQRIAHVGRKQVEGIVIHTTSVRVPKSMSDGEGGERPLKPDEVAAIKASVESYVRAKVDYIMALKQDAARAIHSGANVGSLLQNAEYYALYMKEQHELQSMQEKAVQGNDLQAIARIDGRRKQLQEMGENMQGQAEAFGRESERRNLQDLILQDSVLSMGEGGSAGNMRAFREDQIAMLLMRRSSPTITKFDVRCLETNIAWGPDGNTGKILRAHLMPGYAALLRRHGKDIIDLMNSSDSTQPPSDLVSRMEDKVQIALEDIDAHFLRQTPTELWQGMDDEQVDKIQKFMGLQTEIADTQKRKHIPSTHHLHQSAEEKIHRQKKFVQGVEQRQYDRDINPTGQLHEEKIDERSMLAETRIKKGSDVLKSVGAQQIDGQAFFSLCLGWRDKAVLFYFDVDTDKWKVALGTMWGMFQTYNMRLHSVAETGREVSEFRVHAMPSGLDEQYNAIIAQLEKINGSTVAQLTQ